MCLSEHPNKSSPLSTADDDDRGRVERALKRARREIDPVEAAAALVCEIRNGVAAVSWSASVVSSADGLPGLPGDLQDDNRDHETYEWICDLGSQRDHGS